VFSGITSTRVLSGHRRTITTCATCGSATVSSYVITTTTASPAACNYNVFNFKSLRLF
jgi:hypothetical protein